MIKDIILNDTFWNFISVVSSFIIVKITLKFEEKSSIENIELQKNQQIERQKLDERLHNENLHVTSEQVRATLFPFLKLEQKITIGQRGEQILFPLKVTNLGNSGALDVQIEFKASDELGFLYVDKCKRFDRTDYYLYTDVLYDNVLPVGYSGSFEILLASYKEGEGLIKSEAFGEVHFSILYKDSLYNQYRQEYMFQYGTDRKCYRIESYLPQLIEN